MEIEGLKTKTDAMEKNNTEMEKEKQKMRREVERLRMGGGGGGKAGRVVLMGGDERTIRRAPAGVRDRRQRDMGNVRGGWRWRGREVWTAVKGHVLHRQVRSKGLSC